MYHLKTSIPSYRQVFASTLTKPDSSSNTNVKSHFVYHVEVAFLGEYGKSLDQFDERPNRGAKFYRIEKRYSAFLALHNELRRRYRLHCDFPPKKLRNTTPKVLETRQLALEHYLRSFVRQCQQLYQPLPLALLDFLDVEAHLPKISSTASSRSRIIEQDNFNDFKLQPSGSNQRPIFGFTREPFLVEATQTSITGLPDIVTQATLKCFYCI